MRNVVRVEGAGPVVAPPDPFDMPVSFQGDDLCACAQDNRGVVLDAANEIARHRVCQPVAADQYLHASGGLREKHRRLTGGVATADDDDLLAHAQLRLHLRRAVVHARAFELREVIERRLAVLGAGGDDQRARRDARPVVHLHGVRRPIAGQLRGAFRDHDLGAELLGLRVRASRELQP